MAATQRETASFAIRQKNFSIGGCLRTQSPRLPYRISGVVSVAAAGAVGAVEAVVAVFSGVAVVSVMMRSPVIVICEQDCCAGSGLMSVRVMKAECGRTSMVDPARRTARGFGAAGLHAGIPVDVACRQRRASALCACLRISFLHASLS